MKISKEQRKKQFQAAKKKKQAVESIIEDALSFTYPENLLAKNNKVDQDLIYDNTARYASDSAIANFQSYLIPADSRWGQLNPRKEDDIPIAPDERDFYGNQTDKVFSELNRSNFYVTTNLSLRDYIPAGTQCIAPQWNQDGLYFKHIPITQLYILDNGEGIVDTTFVKHELPARTVASKEGWNVPQEIKDQANQDPEKAIQLIEHAIPCDGKWEYGVSLMKDFAPLITRPVEWNPYIVTRYQRIPGNPWGWSPMLAALPEIRVGNKLSELLLDALEYAIGPPIWTQDGNLKNQPMEPKKFIYSKEKPEPILNHSDTRLGFSDMEIYRNNIREALHVNALPPVNEAGRMTATEVMQRQGQYFRTVGPPARLFEEEFMKPTLDTITKMMAKRGEIDFTYDGKEVEYTVTSVLRKGLEIEKVESNMAILERFGMFGELLFRQVKVDNFIRKSLEDVGFPNEFLNELEEGEVNSEQMQQMQQVFAQLLTRNAA